MRLKILLVFTVPSYFSQFSCSVKYRQTPLVNQHIFPKMIGNDMDFKTYLPKMGMIAKSW
jgi:hypothetical protein